MVNAVLLAFEDEAIEARRLADQGGWSLALINRHRFPDGELRLRLPPRLPDQVIVFRGLHQPNEKLVELLLLAGAARELGVQWLTLVCPYLGYMRQDIAFQPGEVVSQRIVGRFLASLFDAVVTVDPHLHRVATLKEAVPVSCPVVISGAPALADWVARQRPGAILLGPDEEAAQWVAQAAARHGNLAAVCRKVRHGDRQVVIQLPDRDWRGQTVVILDDVASTGHTVAQAARLLLEAGAATVDVAVTHALFAGDALQVLREAGIDGIWSTDCIAHETNVIQMAPALADALHGMRPNV